jgi:hypothetical protein
MSSLRPGLTVPSADGLVVRVADLQGCDLGQPGPDVAMPRS